MGNISPTLAGVFSYEFDFKGLRRLAVMAFAAILAVISRDIYAFAILIIAAYFAAEAHQLYGKAKAYRSLSGHLRRAVNQ